MQTRRPKAIAVLVALGATAAGTQAATAAPIKAAWIYVGPHNDGGWSQAHDNGRKAVQAALGKDVVTTYKEIVPEGPKASQVIDSLVRDGNKIIFATSFGYQDQMLAAAKKYPNVYFEHATGYKTAKNMAQYFGAGEDAIYLSGIAAGAASKTGKIGMVLPFGIPEVVRHANAFTLGAQSVNPKATVRVVFTLSWFDKVKETKAAQSLVAAGVDVLGQNVDSPATGVVAESKGIPWIGYDDNAQSFAPKSWQTAAVYNWGPYYTSRVKAAQAGTWKTGSYYGNLKDKFVGLAPFGASVSAATKAKIAAAQAKIAAKPYSSFTGPVTDQSGKVQIPAGRIAKLPELLTMNYLVKGVIGSIPKA